MTAIVDDYSYYTIQCTFGGRFPKTPHAGYLQVTGGRRDPVGITQWTLDPKWIGDAKKLPFTGHHFHWLFVNAGVPDHYYIVNRRSGLCMRDPAPDKAGAHAPLVQDDYAPDHDPEFRFVVEAAPEGESGYRLVSYSTGNLLLVEGGVADNGQKILSWPEEESKEGLGHKTFELTRVDAPVRVPLVDETDGGGKSVSTHQLPELTSIDQDLPRSFPDRDDARILEQERIPFFKINDPDVALFRQGEVSPYYTLRHWQRWDKAFDRQFDGRTQRETTETTEVGMTQMDAYSFKSTFKWSVETTLQPGYKSAGVSASAKVTAKVEGAAERTSEQSTERKVSRTREEQVTYPKLDEMYRIVTWVPTDVYDLYRTDGTDEVPIQSWAVTREGEDVSWFCPEGVAKPRPKR